MASRESYKIKTWWKHGGKTFFQKLKGIFRLFNVIVVNKYSRHMFMIDNVYMPFNRLVTCRIKNHELKHIDEDNIHYCFKCGFRLNGNKEYNDYIRRQKITRLKKKL